MKTATHRTTLTPTFEFRKFLDLPVCVSLSELVQAKYKTPAFMIPKENSKNLSPPLTFCKIRRTLKFRRGRPRNVQRFTTHVQRAQLLFCSINLLFGGVLVDHAVVVCSILLLLFYWGEMRCRTHPQNFSRATMTSQSFVLECYCRPHSSCFV